MCIMNVLLSIKKKDVIFLFIILLIVYNINLRSIGSGDTIPASLLPFSILSHRSLYLDQFAPYLIDTWVTSYFLWHAKDHYISAYPIVTPVLITPLYIIPYILLNLFQIPIDYSVPAFAISAMIMEKLSASTIAALSGVFVYLSIKELVNKRIAIICALIYTFATNTWTISSQALWQHGMVELLLSIITYILIINIKKENIRNIILMGVLSGLYVFNRPSDSMLLLPLIAYILSLKDRKIIIYLISALCASLPFMAYNYYFFGNILGGYSSVASFSFNADTFVNILGLLISPSRGLLIYTPVVLMALPGIWNVKKIDNKSIRQFLYLAFIAVLLEILVYGSFKIWWAGWSYGPRFLTGTLPFIAVFISLSLPKDINFKRINKREALVIAMLVILLIPSIFSQLIGAFCYPNGNWDGDPNIDYNVGRLWDWNDTQMKRSFNAGPAKPSVLNLDTLNHILSFI